MATLSTSQRYYQEHRETIREQAKSYYWANRQKYLAYNQKYYQEHRVELLAKKAAPPRPPRQPRPPKAPRQPKPKKVKIVKAPVLPEILDVAPPLPSRPPSILIQMPPDGQEFLCRFD